jgi:hypothetical protein
MEDLLTKLKKLEEENIILKNDLEECKEHLKKYTSPSRNKKYYTNNKEKILSKQKSYIISSEKKKEYARTSYLNKKNKQNI